MKITKTTAVDRIPVFRPDLETYTGGFSLVLTGLTLGSVLAPGAAIVVDEIARTAKVIKGASVQANVGSAVTAIPVQKGHGFIAGQFIGKTVGGVAVTVTSVDTTNALYDTLNLSAALGALTAGDALYQAAAAGATGATVYAATPETFGLLKNDTLVEANAIVDVVSKGTVYARRIPAIAPELRRANPLIMYSNSK